MKNPFVEKEISDEREGMFEIVPTMKRLFVEKRSSGGGIAEVVPKMKNPFIEKEDSDHIAIYERLFSGK